MQNLKPITTYYKGYKFRSRLEARWAVFFDACGVKWEYEPEGFDLGDGLYYLPDFLLRGVQLRSYVGDLWVEVKGQMTEESARKILAFSGVNDESDDPDHNEFVVKRPILVVGPIPDGENMAQINHAVQDAAYTDKGWYDANAFNFFTVDGDYFAAHPGVNKTGGFELFGDDSSYLCYQDELRTERAYRAARCARFEHGERRPG
ncbi:MAG: hypothetical protein IKF99_00300 [Oscillospiraceae bacterium]|nr:hypothetical protein [Oscillospiraceae bacterium]MBR3236856.1 hypothetical protein [Oscillospiraceae bacterium]